MDGEIVDLPTVKDQNGFWDGRRELGSLTEPREFNLMFETHGRDAQ